MSPERCSGVEDQVYRIPRFFRYDTRPGMYIVYLLERTAPSGGIRECSGAPRAHTENRYLQVPEMAPAPRKEWDLFAIFFNSISPRINRKKDDLEAPSGQKLRISSISVISMRPFIAWIWTHRSPSRMAASGFVPPIAAIATNCGLTGTPRRGTLGMPTSRIPE